MSERDNFFPPEQFPDDESPQSIPRAGMGIADEIIGAEIPDESSEAVENDAVENDAVKTGDVKIEGEELPDPSTVPELAPLMSTLAASTLDAAELDASTPLVTSYFSEEAGGAPPNGAFRYPDEMDDDDDDDEISAAVDVKAETPSATQDLFSHLGELRNRIVYSVYGILVASILTWNYGQEISEWFARPVRAVLATENKQFKLVTLDPTEGFQTYLQITLVAAILLAMPWILFQMWRFLEPALTKTERKFSIILLPFSILLFFAGCALGYVMSPLFFKFFMMFQPPGAEANFGYGVTIALLAKMILVFGLCFQVPIITIFLNKIGLVSRNFLIDYWRHAMIIIFVVVAVITPTWDPMSLAVCAVPPCVLYGVSIWMVKWL